MRTRSKSIFNLFFLFALLASLLGGAVTYTPARAVGVLYAKPAATGNGNCTSWANACTLQEAIFLSFPGDEIWVKAGRHIPHVNDRTVSFNLKNGVAIYGGFAGAETQRSQRKPAVNITILSGDLNGDDNGFTNNGENSYHVVKASSTDSSTILDGFTITSGNADGDFTSGGGMLNNGGSPTLTNTTFSNNFAIDDGGGIYNDGGSPILTNVTFSNNSTIYDGGSGGGMFNSNSNPKLTNVIFSDNSASSGGGMSNFISTVALNRVIFLSNFAFNTGGGMYDANSVTTLNNVTFTGNQGNYGGGGMFNFGGRSTLNNVTFSNNSSLYNTGGGMSNSSSDPILTNVTFSANSADFSGGGMYNTESNAMLKNVTFSGNSANDGGGMYNLNSSLALINTIIANSPSGGDCVNDSSGLSDWTYNNLVEDPSNTCGLTNGADGNIIGADPKLGTLANNGGRTRTHALLPGSPAIDAGRDANCPATDQHGVTRPQGSHCDMGSYELVSTPVTITGNAGAPGVKLSYIDGTPKTVISQPNGNYSLIVSSNWTGTVTPSHTCFTFSPLDRSYSNVTVNQTAQGFSPSFNPASPCAEVTIKIKGTTGTLVVPKNGGKRLNFAGVNNGPVLVNGTVKSDVSFITSARVSIPGIFFSELMGLPTDFLSTKYAFPYYDNSFFNSQLLLANVSPSAATVTVKIPGTDITSGCTSTPPKPYPYQMGPGTTLRVRCAGVNEGPLVVTSSGAKIIASLRVLPKSSGASVSEVMGVPGSQLADRYAFPWYDNKTLDSQLRVANVGGKATDVRLFIGGVERKNCTSNPPKSYPYKLLPGAIVRVKCAEVNAGPLQVIGVAGIPIVAALRMIPKGTGTNDPESFSEVMGLPASQFAPHHAFPWYDNKQQDTQLRIGNIGTKTTRVRLFIGGVEMKNCTSVPPKPYPYNVPANTSLRVSCAGVNRGPIKVIGSAGVPIVASLRVLPRNAAPGTVFAELMGFPLHKLATGYILPWYDNVNFSTQLRVAVP
jgi:predicted outer membrane repeat protein